MAARRSAGRLNGGLLVRLEIEGRRIDAVAQALGTWAIRKQVTEMAAAAGAAHLGADHAVAAVLMEGHLLAIGRRREARPVAAAVELGRAVEQKLAAAGAPIAA